jgi:TrmH family RNA methyltransferase
MASEMTKITSLQNSRVKAAARLRDRRHRRKQGRIVIDGVRELARALTAGVELLEWFVCEPLCTGDEARRLLARLPTCGGELFELPRPVFEKLAFGQRSEGIVAVAAVPDASLSRLSLPENPLVAVLEGVEKPGNAGAVLRSADAAGLDAVVLADPRTDLYNPNAIRASLGTVFSMPTAVATNEEVVPWLRAQGLTVYAARVDGAIDYTEADFRRPSAIVLGSEAEGLGPPWSGDDVTAVRLPMLGVADSLNVAAAAVVLFYEARRQRNQASERSGEGGD